MADKGVAGPGSAEIEKYLAILAKDPNSRVFASLAEAYRKAGLLDDAVETAREGLKIHPNYLSGRVALGRACFEQKRHAEAREEMERVVKAAPDNLMAHKVLGQIAMALGDLPGAEKAFRMVLLIDPRDQEAKYTLENLAPTSRPSGAVGAPPSAPVPSAAPAPPPPPIEPAPPRPPEPLPPETIPLREPSPLEDLEKSVIGVEEISLPEPEPNEPPMPAPEPPVAPPYRPPALAELALEDFPVEEMTPEPELEPSPGSVAPAEEVHPVEPPQPVTPEAEESPFEVFGRPKRSGPPVSAKGDSEAFAELELEPTSHAPETPGEPAEIEEESPFEIFTRESPPAGTAPEGRRRGGGEGLREIDFESAEELPTPAPRPVEPDTLSLEEEIPRIDLASELDLAPPEEQGDYPIPGPASSFPVAEEFPAGLETVAEVSPADEEAVLGPEADVVSLEEEIPRIDLTGEFEAEHPGEAAPAPGRGVFDTETLATIYVNQGFYARAIGIYERLVAERPDDDALRERLEGVRGMERRERVPPSGEAGESPEESGTHPAAGAAPPESPRGADSETVRQLGILLKVFQGGRPR